MKRKTLIAVSIRPLVLMLVHAREELSFNHRTLNEHRGAIDANETKLGMIFAKFDRAVTLNSLALIQGKVGMNFNSPPVPPTFSRLHVGGPH